MTRRRITATLGAAAGGLLGAALLPVAVAFADDYEILPDPSSTETLTGVYGEENTVPPAENGSIQGYQEFEVLDTTTQQVVGTFYADESNSIDIAGDTNTELLVTSDGTGTVGTAAGDTPAVGSVIDAYTYAGGDAGYVYSDLVSTSGADVISATSVTPFGDFPFTTTFDPVAAESADTALPPITLAGGDEIIPAAGSPEQFTAISGAAPYDTAVQGTQLFDVVNSADTVVGTFDADVTTSSDLAGTTTEALLVTSDGTTGTLGTAAGDTPPVGSVFSTLAVGDIENIYADLTSATPGGADTISDTGVTPFGDFAIPTTFDAVAAESDGATIPFDGYDIVAAPGSTEVLAGINGLPPLDVAVQGYQLFDVVNGAGTVVGTFDADVTTTSSDVYGISTETLLVTSDGTGTPGTAAGDVPPVGSEIDVANYGSGFETVYSDLISTTPVISETLVTPFGDLTMPSTFDAASGLVADTIAPF
jgi:hypothetical protein